MKESCSSPNLYASKAGGSGINRLGRWLACLLMLASFTPGSARALQGATDLHDPSSIIKDATGVYHIWGTGQQIGHLTSPDMVNWTAGKTVFAAGNWPPWIKASMPGFSGNFMAPECVFMNGKYCLYYACSAGANASAIGLATSTDLSNWTDEGEVIAAPQDANYQALDPAVFKDFTGNYWLALGSHRSGIFVVQLDPATGKRRNATLTNVAGDGSSSEHEAALIVPHRSYYYLFFNRGSGGNGTHSPASVSVGRSSNPAGPYFDKTGKALLTNSGTLFAMSSTHYSAPGQLGYFSEGIEYLTYHYYDGNQNETATLAISHLVWGNDGWPVNVPNWIPNGTYKIVNYDSKLAWDAWGCTGESLQAVAQNTYTGLNCQKWIFTSLGNGEVKITCAQGGLAVEVLNCNADAGGLLDLYAYRDEGCMQWKIDRYNDGSFALQNLNGNKVVDVPSGSTAPGTQLQTFNANGLWAQKWLIQVP